MRPKVNMIRSIKYPCHFDRGFMKKEENFFPSFALYTIAPFLR